MLIGANVPKAMEPWKVASSVSDGPYAVRTELGWTVNGPLMKACGSTDMRSPTLRVVNHILVACIENLFKQFKVGGKHHKVETSREDMDMVVESVKLVDGHYTICLPLKNKIVNI